MPDADPASVRTAKGSPSVNNKPIATSSCRVAASDLLQVTFMTPNAWLTGAGARSAEGADTGHQNREAMAHVGVRVEPPARLGNVVEWVELAEPDGFVS